MSGAGPHSLHFLLQPRRIFADVSTTLRAKDGCERITANQLCKVFHDGTGTLFLSHGSVVSPHHRSSLFGETEFKQTVLMLLDGVLAFA